MHYIESGDSTNEAVLLLHGFPDCFFGWRNQINALSQNHRVIVLDLKGFNDSDKPLMRHHYKPEKICTELKQFLDAINVKSACIISHDIGAIIGYDHLSLQYYFRSKKLSFRWTFAYLFPDYVNKFVSISTPHPNIYWTAGKGTWLSKYWFNMIQV
jgi:pimeloyl-ACP methyl ester carboxylesterase